MLAHSLIAAFATVVLMGGAALAHHGGNGQFDTSQSIEVSGIVKKIRFVNPHSYFYFEVTNEDASVDEWRCELSSGSLLKRKGWSVDTIGFEEAYIFLSPRPDGAVKNSTELHVVERFTLSEDGQTLTRDYVAEDPLYIVGTFSGQDVVNLTYAEYEPYDCEDLTGDTY